MHIIYLNKELFETHNTLKSAQDTVKCMRASGDYDSTDNIHIVSYS